MEAVAEIKPVAEKNFSRQKFYQEDFSGRDLSHANFRMAVLSECNFRGSNLSYASFAGANCWGSDFTEARLYRADFKDAILKDTKMHPKDCFGMTLTLSCNTFDGMEVASVWWYTFLHFSLKMKVAEKEKKVQDAIILAIGPEKWLRLQQLFARRSF